jgi:hypothetical protein
MSYEATISSYKGNTAVMAKSFVMAVVGTLNQGYPLLQYEGAVLVRRLLVTWRAAPDPTTWAGLRAPRGEDG